ncbi:MAG: anthranilate phosphoribosyltransferase [Myxococcota bacterium]
MIDRLLEGEHLEEPEAMALVGVLTREEAPEALKAGLLVALRAKGETATELRGMAKALRNAAVPIELGAVLDSAGTGGDGKGTVNLSTAAALVVAAAGYPVAKHGNRSVSSRSGSADVLEALGIPLRADATQAKAQFDAHGFTFLFAPTFHPSMKAVATVRRGMGIRTAFNLIGPLSNPARPATQLIGAFDRDVAERLAYASVGLVPRAFVVHGLSGHDEATPIGPFVRFAVEGTTVSEATIDPKERYGVPRCTPDALKGGDALDNAARLTEVFRGARGPIRDAVVLNAALLLEAHGVADAFPRVTAALDDGAVHALVEALRG